MTTIAPTRTMPSQGRGPTRELAPGDALLGKFVVEHLIGEGGMGRVYSVRHLDLGRSFALKVLRGTHAFDPDSRRRFVAEARAATALWSRHIARVFDSGTLPDGSLFMVLDLLTGMDLATALERERVLSVGATVTLGLQILDALAEAHAAGIVHRDIKPANVFLMRGDALRPEARVLDFGIARDVRKTASSGNNVVGTPNYIAPEQLQGHAVDGRCDLWSLGVTLYECLSGEPPFQGGSIAEIFGSIVIREPPPLPSAVPWELQVAIRRALTKDPSGRFPDAAAMARALLPFVPPHVALIPERWAALLQTARPPPRADTEQLGTMPMSAVVSRVGPRLPRPGCVRLSPIAAEIRSLPLDGHMAYVLGLVDNRGTRSEIVESSALPADETERILEALSVLGVVHE